MQEYALYQWPSVVKLFRKVSTQVAHSVAAPAGSVSGNHSDHNASDVAVIADGYYRQGLSAEARGDLSAAIAAYQQAVSASPSHVDAIAALGQLRFVAPEQPLLSEIRKVSTPRVCEVTLEVRNPCNYRCFYCVAKGHNAEPVQYLQLDKIEEIYARVVADLIVTSLECGGGEPTVHPQFPELARVASKYGAVSFPTNNSQNPERWLPKETAKRLLIRSTLHPESEDNLDRYLKNARYLLDAGCQFVATFIAHPTKIAKIKGYQQLFQSHGILFRPVPFIGEYEGKRYPHAHTDEEKRLVGLDQPSRSWTDRIEPHTTRIRNFRGIPCIAGSQSLYISGKGELRRCLYDLQPIEKPFDSAKPCGVKTCGCGLFLDRLNVVSGISFYNYWAEFVGLPCDERNSSRCPPNTATICTAMRWWLNRRRCMMP